MTRPTGTATRTGAVGVLVLLAALVAWEAFAPSLPGLPERLDVALVACVLIPATMLPAYAFRWFAGRRETLPFALTLTVLAVLLYVVDQHVVSAAGLFNVAKLLALVLLGMWFLMWFETLSWVVLVAAIIPVVDVFSVYRGPTKVVVEQKPSLFDHISISFALPGHDGSANLGPPDVFFFAMFLAATVQFGLRVRATWLAMTACLGATIVATYAFELNGLPALPAVCVGFLGANADLLLARARQWRTTRDAADESRGAPG